jgi:hypothetical protein
VRSSKHKPKPPRAKPARAQYLAEPEPARELRFAFDDVFTNATPRQRELLSGDAGWRAGRAANLKRLTLTPAEIAEITEAAKAAAEDRKLIDRRPAAEARMDKLLDLMEAAASMAPSKPAPKAKRQPTSVRESKPGPRPKKDWPTYVKNKLRELKRSGKPIPTAAKFCQDCQNELGYQPDLREMQRLISTLRK